MSRFDPALEEQDRGLHGTRLMVMILARDRQHGLGIVNDNERSRAHAVDDLRRRWRVLPQPTERPRQAPSSPNEWPRFPRASTTAWFGETRVREVPATLKKAKPAALMRGPLPAPSSPREPVAAFSVGFEERRYPDGAAS
jgi:hypothetical protein